jgi:general stress protein 26
MSSTDEDPVQVLGQQIAGIRFAMLTTYDRNGRLCSRPMTTQNNRFDGSIWFLTDRRTHPAEDIQLHPQVNVCYVDSEEHRYVSVSGTASLVDDRAKMREFWQPAFAVWFPGGPDDPHLVLLRIQVEHADYWDSPSSWSGRLVAFAKALATGDRSALGTRGHVDLAGGAG